MKRPVARVFFKSNDREPEVLIGLPLDAHLANVAALVESWSPERAYGNAGGIAARLERHTRPRVTRAAQRHDEGKRQPGIFKIRKVKGDLNRHSLMYSFAG